MPRKRRSPPIEGLYKHRRLSYKNDEVRLINLKPAKTIRHAVHCDIVSAPLDHAPSYEALSYAWGDSSDLIAIGINSRLHMFVPKCLETALRYLRLKDRDRLLWADAICIDQGSVQERNRVVAKMHLIYSHAHRVVVWLGGPCRPWSFKPVLDAIAAGENDDRDQFTWRCQILFKPHKTARAIYGFASLPWFRRGWVVQETCFAREVIGQYGRHTFPWHELEAMVQRLRITARGTMSGILQPEGRLLQRLMQVMSSLHNVRNQHRQRQPMGLAHMIAFSRTRATSDPRDKLFAYINLLPTVPASLRPDYNKSTPELFREIFRLLLAEMGLKILAECEAVPITESPHSPSRMPSWFPDWSYTRKCEPLPGGISQTFSGDSYYAGSNLEASFRWSTGSAEFVIMGSMFDHIVFLNLQGVKYFYESNYPRNNLWEIMSFLCTDTTPGSLLGTFRLDCHSAFHSAFHQYIARTCNLDRTLEGKRSDTIKDIRRHTHMDNMRRIDGRNLLLTSKGHLGWAPPAAEINDIVVVFPGCHVPVVLRRVHVEKIVDANQVFDHDASECDLSTCQDGKPDYYRIIGEAYIQGIMDGEALAPDTESGQQALLQEFVVV